MRWDYMYGGGQMLEKTEPPFIVKKSNSQATYVGTDSKNNMILKTWCYYVGEALVCGSIKYEMKDVFRSDRKFAIEFNLKANIARNGIAKVRIGNGEHEVVFTFKSNTVLINDIDLRIHPNQFKTFTLFQACKERAELYISTKKRFNRPILKPSTYNGISIEVGGNAEVVLRYLSFCVDYVPCRLVSLGSSEPNCRVTRFVFAEQGTNVAGVETVEVHEVTDTEFGQWYEFERKNSLSINKFQVKLHKTKTGEVVATFRRNKNKDALDIMGGYLELNGDKKVPWTHVIGQEGAAIVDVPWEEAHGYEGFEGVEEKTEKMLSAVIDHSTDKDGKGFVVFGFDVTCNMQDNSPIDGSKDDFDIVITLRWTVPSESSDPKYPFVDLDLWAVSAEEVGGRYVYNSESFLDYTTRITRNTQVIEIDDLIRLNLVHDVRDTHKVGANVEDVWTGEIERMGVKGNYGRILTVGVGNYAAPSGHAPAGNILNLVDHLGEQIRLEVSNGKGELIQKMTLKPQNIYKEGADTGCVFPICDVIIGTDKGVKVIPRIKQDTIPYPIYSKDFKDNLDNLLQP